MNINSVNFGLLNIELSKISEKVFSGQRISEADGLYLYNNCDLGILGYLANFVREKINGDNTYFNRNFHIEPTNICIYDCEFCSYKAKINDLNAWDYNIEEMMDIVKSYDGKPVTEVHIVGGVHPHRDLFYYGNLLQKIKNHRQDIHIKAFTAVELDFMIKKAKLSIGDGLQKLKEFGLDSIPGGGAEIFHEDIRKHICDSKASTNQWLGIHECAHKNGIPSNATILYGHIEKYEHRIHHLNKLRELQDKTGGFNTFIPLKYKKENNRMSEIGETTTIEDLKNFAVSRIFLDNIPHLKAYWPMLGYDLTQLSLSFGVDDIDGTIDDSTKIYSMAGAKDKNPKMTTEQLVILIKEAKRIPIERDTLYNTIKEY